MSSPPLDKLDKQIAKVLTRVKKLESENNKLRQKASKLEQSLEAAPNGGSEAWESERAEIVRRLEQLTEHLETALAE